MIKHFKTLNLTAIAVLFTLGLAAAKTAQANVVLNGWFTQPAFNNTNQVCMTGPAGGWSAAADWSQMVVVPNSYFCTYLESAFLPRIRVRTNGGDALTQGNGIQQNFSPLACAKATYWYNMISGELTGNLVGLNGAFVDFNSVLHPIKNNPGAWKQFTSISSNARGIAFETLAPVGLISEVQYQLMDVDVEPQPALACSVTAFKALDLSQYLTCGGPGCPPSDSLNDPSGPVVKIRITNVSSVTVQGPVHVLLDGLPAGRAVVNPDGDYLGSPFINLVSRSLEPGQTEELTIQFNADPAGRIPSYRVRMISGDF
jgi:hypothetical protein